MQAFTVFIRHPVVAAMINLALVMAGLYSYTRLNVDLMPAVDKPIVKISVQMDGASPEEIESNITRAIENAVSLVGGIQEIRSYSQLGSCNVTVEFTSSHDGEQMLQECRDRVGEVASNLPTSAKPPVFTRTSASDQPIMTLAVTGNRTTQELTALVDQVITKNLTSVAGVGEVKVSGGRYREIQVEARSDQLKTYGLSITQVQKALSEVGADIPGGFITSPMAESLMQISTRAQNVAAIGETIVSYVNDPGSSADKPDPSNPASWATHAVRVRDVASVVDGIQEVRSLARLNGRDVISLRIIKNSDANIVKVTDDVKYEMKRLKEQLPADVRIQELNETAVFVRQSVAEMTEHLVLGALLAALTILVFMGSVRLMLIGVMAIPVSILSAFTLMFMLDYTLNYMTLLALTLAIGLVIDDAVVVLENVWRLMEEEGLAPREAAERGLQEIAFAVLATTLSLIVLFLPLGLMPGEIGEYFRSWSVTLAFTIFISMVVSFTLTPMLCAKLLRPIRRKAGGAPRVGLATRMVQTPYLWLLRIAMKVRFLIILGAVLSVVWGAALYQKIGKEFTASQDESQYSLSLTFPRGWPLARTSAALKPIEEQLRKLKGIKTVLASVDDSDVDSAEIDIELVPYPERAPYTQQDSQRAARAVLNQFPLLNASSANEDFQMELTGDDPKILNAAANRMVAELSKISGFVEVKNTLRGSQPSVSVRVDRTRAADLGVDPKEAGQAMQIMVGGLKVARYVEGDQTYDVNLRLQQSERSVPGVLADLWIPSRDKSVGLVALAEVATITPGLVPSEIDRFNRRRVVTIESGLTKEMPLETATRHAKRILADMHLPAGYGLKESGKSLEMKEMMLFSFESFVLSVALMYMVLASQFENLLDPIIILLTLPLAVPFALVSLTAAHMTLNLFSMLGLFLLFGVVKKNAILQIDRTNELIAGGTPLYDAVLQANKQRLRPILMTTVTLVVALIPAAMAGPTGATQSPMAVVVVGGQSMCLLLTLLLVPAASSYADQLKQIGSWRIWQRLGWRRSEETSP